MVFDHYNCANAHGVILAHTIRLAGKTFAKGRILSDVDLAELQEGGIDQVAGVRLESGDVDENQAALELASVLAGPQIEIGKVTAGRCNLYAQKDGLSRIDRAVVDAINLCDAGILIATLAEDAECLAQQAVASIKVIPFAVPRSQLDRTLNIAKGGDKAIGLAAFSPCSVALILTETPGLKESMLRSTSRVTTERVTALGSSIVFESRCAHSVPALESALKSALDFSVDLILVCGASITVDCADTIPSAIVNSGGSIDHFGMPVEPGNMLLAAHIGDCQVINMPGCSRSPKLNGLDWVMQRMSAGLSIAKADILSMGVGGLIKDVSHRWRMREQSSLMEQLQPSHRVAAIVLGAGRSARMGEQNKLLARVGGVPMLQRVVDAALGADVCSVTVVTGCQAEEAHKLLQGRDIAYVHNDAYREGLAGSLKRGLSSVAEDVDGVMILLADMPFINSVHINELIAEFNPAIERDIVAPIRDGRLGNPVIWATRYLSAMMQLEGDRGARGLLDEYAANVWEVPMGDDAMFVDIDTVAELAVANNRSEGAQ
ncbi:MAG: NTP transferase domain-containing protein [Halieaceae bacterium]|nr:NTP transferase domain-containing protein [Halieaceae bacterium]